MLPPRGPRGGARPGERRGKGRHTFLLPCLLALAASCVGTRPSPLPTPSWEEGGRVILHARNGSLHPVRVLVRTPAGAVEPLGELPPGAGRRFVIPWPGRDDLRIELEGVGGGDHRLPVRLTDPGETLILTIPSRVTDASLRH